MENLAVSLSMSLYCILKKPREASELHLVSFHTNFARFYVDYLCAGLCEAIGPETLRSFIVIHVGCSFGTVSNMQACEDALFGGATYSLLRSCPLML